MTLVITSVVIGLCYLIKGHYVRVRQGMKDLDETLLDVPVLSHGEPPAIDRSAPTAIQLVSGYSGFGVHTLFSILSTFPKTYKNVVFVSVALIDSGSFKGAEEVEALEASVQAGLEKYVAMAHKLGFAAEYRTALATDVVESAVDLCKQTAEEFPRSTVFTGQITFRLEKFYHRLLHNETAFAIQRRLQWDGLTTVIMPIRVRT